MLFGWWRRRRTWPVRPPQVEDTRGVRPWTLAEMQHVADGIIPEGVEMTEQQSRDAVRVRTGILRSSRPMTDNEVEELHSEWARAYVGPDKAHLAAELDEGEVNDER